MEDIANICQRHFNLLLENKGERVGTNLMRKHFSNYIKGFPGASKYRQQLVTAQGLQEMRSALNDFVKNILKSPSIDI